MPCLPPHKNKFGTSRAFFLDNDNERQEQGTAQKSSVKRQQPNQNKRKVPATKSE
jgi:hypothetical protein